MTATTALAPGRINLIGEHVDHMGYSVAPFAIDKGIHIKIEPSSTSKFLFSNKDALFPTIEFDDMASFEFQEMNTEHRWINYILSGLVAVLEMRLTNSSGSYKAGAAKGPYGYTMKGKMASKFGSISEFSSMISEIKPFHVSVHADLPYSGGLSSSSALCCGSAAAFAHYFGLGSCLETDEGRSELATRCTDCERMTGLMCGGMDQATICLGKPKGFLHIEFVPSLKATPYSLPEGLTLIVANSMVNSNKQVLHLTGYNKRLFEMKAGILMVLKNHQERNGNFKGEISLPPHMKTLENLTLLNLQIALDERDASGVSPFLDFTFDPSVREVMNKDEIQKMLTESAFQMLMSDDRMQAVYDNNEEFKPYFRLSHVWKEATRTMRFVQACATGSADPRFLGQLVDESGKSLKELYECSTPELDEICRIATSNGALGARLCGAGWGGCAIAMCRNPEEAEEVCQAIKNHYYRPIAKENNPKQFNVIPFTADVIDSLICTVQPVRGVHIISN